MARTRERYQQADVSRWGFIAIGCVGFAFASANISALLPASWLVGLHDTRFGAGSFAEIQSRVASLQEETTRLRIENRRITVMLTRGDRNRLDVTKRVGALESSIPVLLEQIPLGPDIDSAMTTASVNATPDEVRDVLGGAVAISRQPLTGVVLPQEAPSELPLVEARALDAAEAIVPGLTQFTSEQYGLAMGGTVSIQEAYIYWTELRSNIGALLLGLEPILSRGSDGNFHVVAGPIAAIAEAEGLCTHIMRTGVQCLPVPYTGYALPQ